MLSFVSFNVASSLGASINFPNTGNYLGSANFTLSKEFIENVGNIALPIFLSTKDSHISKLLSVAIPGSISDHMYNDSSNSTKSYGSSKAIAESFISAIQAHTSTST